MPAQNRFTPSFVERNRQSRVARGLEEEDHPVFVPYRIPVRREPIATRYEANIDDRRFLLDSYGYSSTITGRFAGTINIVEPGSTIDINGLGWHTPRITPREVHVMPVSDERDLTPIEITRVELINEYKDKGITIDFWVLTAGGIKTITNMMTSHIVNTLRVIWNHTRVTQIEPVKRYIFDRRVYTPWYITQVTAALIHELQKRLATTGGVAGYMEILEVDWANRSLISPVGLLGAQQ